VIGVWNVPRSGGASWLSRVAEPSHDRLLSQEPARVPAVTARLKTTRAALPSVSEPPPIKSSPASSLLARQEE
jgi:hypothetical protein